MITAFRGWNDGGQAATVAAGYLARQWDATRFADIDPEAFVDFQAVRPTVTLDVGLTRHIEWPENAFFHGRSRARARRGHPPRGGAELPLARFHRPRHRPRARAPRRARRDARCAPRGRAAPRPAPVTGAATDPRLVEELGLQLSRYEGPTGIVGVLHDACRTAELRSVSLWSAVPHYVSLAPSPRAAKALCVRLSDLVGVPIETTELDEAEDEYEAQVSEAVASDPDTQAYVEELERRADTIEAFTEGGELPSGESLAAELTRSSVSATASGARPRRAGRDG